VLDVAGEQVSVLTRHDGVRFGDWMPRASERLAPRGSRCADRPEPSPPPSPELGATAKRWKRWGDDYAARHLDSAAACSSSSSSSSSSAASNNESVYTHLGSTASGDEVVSRQPAANLFGFALRKNSSATSSSSVPTRTLTTIAHPSAASFHARHKRLLISRTSYAKLAHLVERCSSSTGRQSNFAQRSESEVDAARKAAEVVHKIMTGEDQQQHVDGGFNGGAPPAPFGVINCGPEFDLDAGAGAGTRASAISSSNPNAATIAPMHPQPLSVPDPRCRVWLSTIRLASRY
jgi:hypothetical protein